MSSLAKNRAPPWRENLGCSSRLSAHPCRRGCVATRPRNRDLSLLSSAVSWGARSSSPLFWVSVCLLPDPGRFVLFFFRRRSARAVQAAPSGFSDYFLLLPSPFDSSSRERRMGRLGVSRKREQRKWGSSRRRHEREDKGVRHRASPGRIMKLYAHLTAGQREMIEGAGFGALLRIQCPTLPSRICTWLIRRFDPESCELVIPGRGRIPVTVDSVHRVLGIPNRGRDVVYKMDEESIEFVFDKYGVERPPSVASLEKSLMLMKSADEHFLRTFMLLVLATFLCPNSSLKVSPRCFPALVDIGSIRELNWCKFVVEQLEKCISSYGKKNTVGGCLFYLLIAYLDSLDIQRFGIPDGTPRISAWDKNLISKVIVMDRKNKTSFGKCFLKRETTCNINSSGASFLLGDVLAIANFVSSNVLPEYSQQNKEVLCKATGNLCASITDALAKFMREVSGLEGCSRETVKDSTEVAVSEDNNVKNDGGQMDVDTLPDDSSELATNDMEDTSVDEHEDGSSGESEAGNSSSTDSEDDPDWEDFSNSITRFHSRQNRVTRNSDNSKEPGDGDVTTNGSGNMTTNSSGNDSDIPEGNLGKANRCSEEHGDVVKLTSPNVHEDVVLPCSAVSQATRGKAGDVTTNGSGNDLGIPEGDQGRVNHCTNEHLNVAKLISTSGHEDVVVPTSAVSQAKGTKQKNTKKRYFLEDNKAIQPARLLYGGSSTLALYDNGNPSKKDKSMEKTPVINVLEGTPVIDLSTPTSSDGERTVKRTITNPPVNGPKRSS